MESDINASENVEKKKDWKEKLWGLVKRSTKTENEKLSENIILAIKTSNDAIEAQVSVRHYLWLSYTTKIGLSVVGYFKLQAIISLLALGMPIWAKFIGVVL